MNQINNIFGFLFSILAAASIYYSFKYFKYVQYLKNIPTARIRSAPQGYIELIGKAKPLSSIPYYVPETDIPCVWFECQYGVGGGEHSQGIHKKTEQSFLVGDDTSACRIDPFDIEIITALSKTRSFKRSIGNPPGVRWVRWIGIDEEVHVYGKFTTLHVDYGKQENELKKSRLKALKADRELMMKFDLNNDGKINIEEWETARRHVEKEVDEYIFEKQKQHKNEYVENVIRKPDDPNLPYLISAHGELSIIRRYQLYSIGLFLLFLIFVTAIIKNIL